MLGGGWEWQRDRLQPSAAGPTLPRVALSSPSLPQTPGVSPHMQAGVRVSRGATKEQEAAAAEPQESFYCTPEQGRDTEACPKAQPDPASSGNRTLGAGAPPCLFPSSHRPCSRGWSRAGSQTLPSWVEELMEGKCSGRELSPAQLGTSAPLSMLQPPPSPQGEHVPGANGAKGGV